MALANFAHRVSYKVAPENSVTEREKKVRKLLMGCGWGCMFLLLTDHVFYLIIYLLYRLGLPGLPLAFVGKGALEGN